jgi:hypothetical protein
MIIKNLVNLTETSIQYPYVDITALISRLRKNGWSDERLVKNDLIEPLGREGREYGYAAFWRTILQIAVELRSMDIPHIFVKCVREYRYCDSNVDVLVPRQRMKEIANEFYKSHWVKPLLEDTIEQLIMERSKLKLQSTTEGILPVHLYGAVSWRYQDDIGLLRKNSYKPNEAHLKQIRVAEFTADEQVGLDPDQPDWVWIPDDAVEFVLQAAHVIFENYRITLGEAIHFRLLRERATSAWPQACQIAKEHGCKTALRLLDEQSEMICSDLENLNPHDFPRPLPLSYILPAFIGRMKFLARNRRYVSATNEVVTSIGAYCGLYPIRRLRRLKRGFEDFR